MQAHHEVEYDPQRFDALMGVHWDDAGKSLVSYDVQHEKNLVMFSVWKFPEGSSSRFHS